MTMKLVIASVVIVPGLAASYTAAEPARFAAPFGFLQPDSTCPDATHILRYPCPGLGPDFYLSFPKSKAQDIADFEGQNVEIRGTVHDSACPLTLVQVSKIRISAVLPPCPDPGP